MSETKNELRDDLLINAERLLADAEHLYANGRSRSAATLIVVSLEQMGASIEALTLETYPNAELYMGLFDKNISHAKRQDALAAHVLNFALVQFHSKLLNQKYIAEHKTFDGEHFRRWLLEGGGKNLSIELSSEQQEEWRKCPDLATAHRLLHLARTGALKHLREFGLYQNTGRSFSEAEIKLMLELASAVRAILSRSSVSPEAPKMAGINMPEGLSLDANEAVDQLSQSFGPLRRFKKPV